MRDVLGPNTTLGYCTNVHAGASFDEMRSNLLKFAVPVKQRVSPGGPAAEAGIAPGDVILGIGNEPVRQLETLWRRVRALGPAGVEVRLKMLSRGQIRDVTLKSRDRRAWLKLDRTY